MKIFELFLNRLLTPERGRSYTPPIDDVAADAAGAVWTFLETSRVCPNSDQLVGAKPVRPLRVRGDFVPSLSEASGFHQDAAV